MRCGPERWRRRTGYLSSLHLKGKEQSLGLQATIMMVILGLCVMIRRDNACAAPCVACCVACAGNFKQLKYVLTCCVVE